MTTARLLKAHGIRVEELAATTRVSVDRFIIEHVNHAERAFQGHKETWLTGRFERSIVEMPAGSIVVLHACCHNPTGVDLSGEQWTEVLDLVRTRGLVPFLDLAYQGFGDGLEPDAYAVRLFANSTSPVFVSSSFSKSFSLYGERIGALSLVAANADEAAAAELSHPAARALRRRAGRSRHRPRQCRQGDHPGRRSRPATGLACL